MGLVLRVIALFIPKFRTDRHAINCHPKYVSRENNFGEDVMVTNKGAITARDGELDIIPGKHVCKIFYCARQRQC